MQCTQRCDQHRRLCRAELQPTTAPLQKPTCACRKPRFDNIGDEGRTRSRGRVREATRQSHHSRGHFFRESAAQGRPPNRERRTEPASIMSRQTYMDVTDAARRPKQNPVGATGGVQGVSTETAALACQQRFRHDQRQVCNKSGGFRRLSFPHRSTRILWRLLRRDARHRFQPQHGHGGTPTQHSPNNPEQRAMVPTLPLPKKARA